MRFAGPMSKIQKILQRILSGASDSNIAFAELRHLVLRFGFDERIRGDHHIYTKTGIEEIINLQPNGNTAKPYQVKQVREIIVKYRLSDDNEQ